MENDFIDKLAREALKDYKASYDRDDWTDLEARLEEERREYPPVWWYKAAELLILALLFFTVYPWMTSGLSKEKVPVSSSTETEPQQTEPLADKLPTTWPQPTTATSATVQTTPVDLLPPVPPTIGATTSGAADFEETPTIVSPTAVSSKQTKAVTVSNQETAIEEIATAETFSEAQSTQVLASTPRSIAKGHIDVTPLEATHTGGDEEEPLTVRRVAIKVPHLKTWRLTVLASPDVSTKTSLGVGQAGYTVGGLLMVEWLPKFFLEGGLLLQHKSYFSDAKLPILNGEGEPIHPNALAWENKYSHLTVVQLPLGVQYEILENRKWRLHGSVALGTNFILDRRQRGTERLSYMQADGLLEVESEIERLSDTRGFLQGGTHADNLFFTLNVGLGVERQLSARSYIFMQPTYQRAYTTLRKSGDRLNTFSLVMGARFELGKKKVRK